MADLDPSTTSADYKAMAGYWRMVDDILGGAKTMRAAGEAYLPKFAEEEQDDYVNRVKVAPFTNIYGDTFRNLASKPFEQEVRLDEDAPERCKVLVEDIDSAGNHMHVFARDVFKAGINYGVDWILVDHTRVPAGVTLADERNIGARPYWTRIPATKMLAVYQAMVGGSLQFVHARIDETVTERDGFEEVTIHRIRVLNRDPDESGNWGPATWQLWEEQEAQGPRTSAAAPKTVWTVVEEGAFSIGIIPLVAFVTGEHELGSWQMRAPLHDLAYMQVTEYQMEANLAHVQTMTAFPIFVVQGADKPDGDGKVKMGPRTVLWLPPIGENGSGTGDFKFVEPSGSASESLREDLKLHRDKMRDLGMQPLLPQSGNITATFTAVAEAKAHSAVEMWALALKDALELAWVYTCMWLGIPEQQAPGVHVHTDFSVGAQSVEEMAVIKELHADALISGEARINEAVRRGLLGPTYNRETDKELILEEIPAEPDEEDLNSALPPPREQEREEEDA